ncbi:MAG: TIGR00725 family protein [Peptococcaceae bacterium]|nr:MAG: TIGR00725 family protein [Peptococcaceae bacterium]
MIYIGVIGSGECGIKIASLAEQVGREIARRGCALICGGRGGVMEAAARGAIEAGGLTVGILPGRRREDGNHYLTVTLATGLGEARNAVIACASDAIIAIAGGYGTLSEIGLALKMGKPVIGLCTWQVIWPGTDKAGFEKVDTASEAVDKALLLAGWNKC